MRSAGKSAVVGRDPRQAIRDSIVISKGLVACMCACRRHACILSEDPEFLGEGVLQCKGVSYLTAGKG